MRSPLRRTNARAQSAAALLLVATSSCGLGASSARAAEIVRPTVLATFPHDASAFTQGLVFHEGVFYESTGLYGESTLREVEPESGRVLRSIPLLDDEFGEGLALVGERLIQLTWRNGIAHEYARSDFAWLRSWDYVGEGWGLCHDGQRLVMSDGSSRLTFRDSESFAALGSVDVTLDASPIDQLNELECVGQRVYANVWQTNWIVEIDPATGEVVTRIDASGLLSAAEAAQADVLNGIAYDEANAQFFITGKLWPKLFAVRFGPKPTTADAGPPASATGDAGTMPLDAATGQMEPDEMDASEHSQSASMMDAAVGDSSETPTVDADAGASTAAPVVAELHEAGRPDPDAQGAVSPNPPGADAALTRNAGASPPAKPADAGCDCAVGRGELPQPLLLVVAALTCGFGWRRRATSSASRSE